jgi:type IV secretory pathway VirJ component
MNRVVAFFFAGLLALSMASGIRAEETTAQFGRFGKIALYYPSAHPAHVVLFVSGDGGWNIGVVDMARQLAALDALVVGVDITYYFKQLESSSESCVYPAADFELLSKFVQKKLGFPQHITPVLIGYSSGATLAYAAIVQAPANTFRGAISLGFCPDIALSKPFCRGSGLAWTKGPQGKGSSFLPATRLAVPWIAFQGTIDQVCDAEKTRAYVKQVNQGQIVMLPKVGHGFSVPKNWLPQLKNELAGLMAPRPQAPVQASAGELGDLPLLEIAAQGPESDYMAVFWSGDGGWAELDQETDSLCPLLQGNNYKKVALPGAHHFGGDYAQIAETILGEMK